jgi:hypothetical protein
MDSLEKQEISLIIDEKEYKIFTCCDPYAKDAIIDSNLNIRMPEVIQKIENILNNSTKTHENNVGKVTI